MPRLRPAILTGRDRPFGSQEGPFLINNFGDLSGTLCRVEKKALSSINGLSGVTVSNSFPSQFFKVAVLVNGLAVFVGVGGLNGDGLFANRAQQRWRLRVENAGQKRRKSEWHTSRPHGDGHNFTRSALKLMRSLSPKC